MPRASASRRNTRVALLAEGVDRNCWASIRALVVQEVALLAEGVDRNKSVSVDQSYFVVALLAEGVDRNGSRRYSVHRYTAGRPPRGGRG